jgi:hypothetical protein
MIPLAPDLLTVVGLMVGRSIAGVRSCKEGSAFGGGG